MIPIPIGSAAHTKDCCVISLATGREAYLLCLKRLEESLRQVRFRGDFLGWSDELPEGSPTQLESPMAFKTFCFHEAKRQGYRLVLWIDAPVVALRSLKPIFDMIRKYGYVTFTNNYGQSLGQWSSDEVLEHHKISRELAMQIAETPTSVIGLDLGSAAGMEFLNRWHAFCTDGLTCRGRREPYQSTEDHYAVAWNHHGCISKDPRVGGHRFDQTAAGLVAHELGMPPYADNLRDIHYKETTVSKDTILLHHREFGTEITPLKEIRYRVFVYQPFLEAPKRRIARVLRGLKNRSRQLIHR
jgi:hypothetical protein